jgi:hypothetical protein
MQAPFRREEQIMRKKKYYLEDSGFVLRPDWKAKLADMIMHDLRLSVGERVLGFAIVEEFRSETRIYRSREQLAAKIGVEIKSITRYLAGLERFKYFKVRRPVRGQRKGKPVYGGWHDANTIFFPVELVRNAVKKDKQNKGLQQLEGQNVSQDEGYGKAKVQRKQWLKNLAGQNVSQDEGQNVPPYTNRRGAFAFPRPLPVNGGPSQDASAPPPGDRLGGYDYDDNGNQAWKVGTETRPEGLPDFIKLGAEVVTLGKLAARVLAFSETADKVLVEWVEYDAEEDGEPKEWTEVEYLRDSSPLAVGDRATHVKFGNGNIILIEDDTITVQFDGIAGVKRLASWSVKRAVETAQPMKAAE